VPLVLRQQFPQSGFERRAGGHSHAQRCA
jgi:hypothetical protein